jgi:chromate transporter
MRAEKATKQKKKVSGRQLLDLFACTFKIGAVTFGGGYVIVPMLEREFVEKRHYIKDDDILDIVAISQSLPGVISINACIMVGYRVGGVLAALVTSLGVVLPSFIILSILTHFYTAVADNPYVTAAFTGISAAVVALMLDAVIRLGKGALKNMLAWAFMLGAFGLAYFAGINGIYLIIAAGVLGFVFSFTPFGYKKEGEVDD